MGTDYVAHLESEVNDARSEEVAAWEQVKGHKTRIAELERKHERLREVCEGVVMACLPVLPLRGSYESGYKVQERFDRTVFASAEEWADAADAIAGLHNVLNHKPLEPPVSPPKPEEGSTDE